MTMSDYQSKLPFIIAKTLTGLGSALFVLYLVYLPFPSLFETRTNASIGLVFYSLATAGAGFVSWGIIMGTITADGVSKEKILRASAIGLGMLALMRLEVAIFPHAPFDELLFLPVTEFIVFSVVAIKLYKS